MNSSTSSSTVDTTTPVTTPVVNNATATVAAAAGSGGAMDAMSWFNVMMTNWLKTVNNSAPAPASAPAATINSVTTVSSAVAGKTNAKFNSADLEADQQFSLPPAHVANSVSDVSEVQGMIPPNYLNYSNFNSHANMQQYSGNNINNNNSAVVSPSKQPIFSRPHSNAVGKSRAGFNSVPSDNIPNTDAQNIHASRARGNNGRSNNNRNTVPQYTPPQYAAEYDGAVLQEKNQRSFMRKGNEIQQAELTRRNDEIDAEHPERLPFRVWFYQIGLNPVPGSGPISINCLLVLRILLFNRKYLFKYR